MIIRKSPAKHATHTDWFNMLDIDEYIRPSALAAIALCNGRARAEMTVCKRFPWIRDVLSSGAADQGTRAHQVIARTISEGFCNNWKDNEKAAENAIRLMYGLEAWAKDATKYSITFAYNTIRELSKVFEVRVLVEHHFKGNSIGIPRGGTADLVLLCYIGGKLIQVVVIDWKTGFTYQGLAEDSVQLGAYGAMAQEECKPQEGTTVYLVSGRRKEVSRCLYDSINIHGVKQYVQTVADRAREQNQTTRATLAGCRYCLALCFCKTARRKIMEATKTDKIRTTLEACELFQFIGDSESADKMQLFEDMRLASEFVKSGKKLCERFALLTTERANQ
jgi:hypothetical protein